jgi:hypothetical protein
VKTRESPVFTAESSEFSLSPFHREAYYFQEFERSASGRFACKELESETLGRFYHA